MKKNQTLSVLVETAEKLGWKVNSNPEKGYTSYCLRQHFAYLRRYPSL